MKRAKQRKFRKFKQVRRRPHYRLDDLLAQMSSEVGALHSQIRPGPARPLPENPSPAFLGAVTERVAEGERVARIYRTDPELPEEAAPLAKAGLKEGDVIIEGPYRVLARQLTHGAQVIAQPREQWMQGQ